MAGIKVTAIVEDLPTLRDKFNGLPKKVSATLLASAINKAIEPTYRKLLNLTPVGPTGNLRRAVSKKVKAYPKSGNAVGLVGYARSGTSSSTSAQGGKVQKGKDRAFHQGFIEFGTKRRVVQAISWRPYQRKSKLGNTHWVIGQNAYIASSFKRLGPFRIRSRGGSFTTSPPYPKAFFKKSDEPIVIEGVRAGGKSGGGPPIRRAFEQTQSEVSAILQRELGLLLQEALDTITYLDQGTVSR